MQTFARNMTPDRPLIDKKTKNKKKSYTSHTKPSTPKTYLGRGKHSFSIYLVGIVLKLNCNASVMTFMHTCVCGTVLLLVFYF